MTAFFEKLVSGTWNALARPRGQTDSHSSGLLIGNRVSEEGKTGNRVYVPTERRPEHIVIWGRTGSGKSSAMKFMAMQDIDADRPFIWIDHHGDGLRSLLRYFAARERAKRIDLSPRIILIEPSDPITSVGMNVLESTGRTNFVTIAEFAQILKQRWHLEHFGARTEELLRNSLFVLAENGLTLIEIVLLLTNPVFRAQLLQNITNQEVRAYFEDRYNAASEAMRGAMRDPVLNKLSHLSSDPAFRHILGQRRSTFKTLDALEQGHWILLNLSKATLGEQAQTFGSLFLARLKAAVFQRRSRSLYTAYCDEIQNLVASDDGIEVLFSESRKQSFSLVTANQFMEQASPTMRAAMLAVQTHLVFRLSSTDAEKMASAFDGGKRLATLLRNLPHREAVLQTGNEPWQHIQIPNVTTPNIETTDLVRRIRQRWARPRAEIEREIAARQPQRTGTNAEGLNDWE